MSEFNCIRESEKTQIQLEGRVDIRRVQDLYHLLIDELNDERKLAIDLTKTEWVDTACLQLLLSAQRSAPERVSIQTDPSSVVHEWLRLCGIGEHLLLDSSQSD